MESSSTTPQKRGAGSPYDPETPPQKTVQTSVLPSDDRAPSSSHHQLSDWHDYEMTSWRDCQNVQDLTKVYTLDDTVVRNLEMTLELSSPASFLETFVVEAQDYVFALFVHLQAHAGTRAVGFFTVPPKNPRDMDKMINIYFRLLGISATFKPRYIKQYVEVLLQIIPKPVKGIVSKVDAISYPRGVKSAFCKEPAPGRDMVTPLYKEITELFTTYWKSHDSYMAPYTSLLGPSGIGKSYAIRQIAQQDLGYVVYTCLTREISGAYPPRSIIADILLGQDKDAYFSSIDDEDLRRETATSLYECYFAAGVINVSLCRKFGIKPSVFYDSQTEKHFSDFQSECAEALKLLFGAVSKTHQEICAQEKKRIRSDETGDYAGPESGENINSHPPFSSFDHLDHIDRCINVYEEAADRIFNSLRNKLESSNLYKPFLDLKDLNLSTQVGHPAVIFCVDEVNELFGTEIGRYDPSRFLALRRACRHRSHVSLSETEKKFFVVLSDTCSKVSYTAPPFNRDPSAKFKPHLDLLKPIYELDSMDLFGEDGQSTTDNTAIDIARLFSVGRPLWGAYIREPSLGLDAAINLAHVKVGCGRDLSSSEERIGQTQAVALLSYRVGFYILRRELAEELVSGYLHYFVSISKDRRFIRTKAPAEPILAYASALQTLRKPQSRSDVIYHFYSSMTSGSIHVGDIGELVSTILLLFTADKLLNPEKLQPVSLPTFLKTFLPSPVLASVMTNMRASTELNGLLEDGRLFFNRFKRYSQPVTQQKMKDAFYQGAAILPPFGFKGADIIIPIHRRGQDKFSYIIIQVKNRKDDVLGDGLKQESCGACSDAAGLLGPAVPYLGMLMSLRSKSGNERMEVVHPVEQNFGPETRPKNKPKETPRVIITSVGMNQALFPGVSFPDEDFGIGETQLIFRYLKDLLECNVELPMDKRSMTAYHRRLLG